MEEQIVSVLMGSPEPLSALEIGKKLGKPKGEINKVLYKMGNVEKIGDTSPKWRLKQSTCVTPTATPTTTTTATTTATATATTGATPVVATSQDDGILKDKIVDIITKSNTPPEAGGLSAPDIYKKLNDATVGMAAVKRVLHNSDEFKNIAPGKGSKPMWVLSSHVKENVSSPSLQLGGEKLYIKEERDGEIAFKEVKGSVLESRPPTNGSNDDDEVKSKPQTKSSQEVDSLSGRVETLTIEDLPEEEQRKKVLELLEKNPERCYKAKDVMNELKSFFDTRDKALDCLIQLHEKKLIWKTNDDSYRARLDSL